MVVRTETPQVVEARKEILRMMLSSGNHNCAVRGRDDGDWTEFQLGVEKADASDGLCPVWGDCRLQDLAYRYQVSGEDVEGRPATYPMETVNPFIVRDFSRCILCGRCVQACNEVQVNNAIKFGYQGAKAKNHRCWRPSAQGFGLRFLWRMRPGLSCRRFSGKGCPLSGASLGNQKSPHNLQLLRRGVPDPSTCQRGQGGESHRC
jgi:ferredoxin